MNFYKNQAKQLTAFMVNAKGNIATTPNMVITKVIYTRLLTTELAPIAAEIAGKMKLNISANAIAQAHDEIVECAEAMVDALAELFWHIRDFMSAADARIFVLEASHQFSLEMT